MNFAKLGSSAKGLLFNLEHCEAAGSGPDMSM